MGNLKKKNQKKKKKRDGKSGSTTELTKNNGERGYSVSLFDSVAHIFLVGII